MRLIPLRALLCGGAAVAALVVLDSLTPSRAQPRQAIEPGNVNRLTVAWTYDTRDSTAPVRPDRKSPAFEATPVYADGRLYLSTPYGTVAALDADTGKEVWRTDLAINRDANYSEFTDRGPALGGDRLYVGTVDARLVCLERRDGTRCQGFGNNGQIDLTAGPAAAAAVRRRVRRQLAGRRLSRSRHRRLVRRRQQPRPDGVGRSPCLRREDGGAALDVPSASRRRAGRRRQHLVAHRRRRRARPGAAADEQRQP